MASRPTSEAYLENNPYFEATGTLRFAAGDHALCSLKSCRINQDDRLLFGSGIEEVERHVVQNLR